MHQLLCHVPNKAYYINAAYHIFSTIELCIRTEDDDGKTLKRIPYGEMKYNPHYFVECFKYLLTCVEDFDLVYVIFPDDYSHTGTQVVQSMCGLFKHLNAHGLSFTDFTYPDYISTQYGALDMQVQSLSRQDWFKSHFQALMQSPIQVPWDSVHFIGTMPYRKRPRNVMRLIPHAICYLCHINGESPNGTTYISECPPDAIQFLGVGMVLDTSSTLSLIHI